MISVIEPNGVDTVSIPVISDLSMSANSSIQFTKICNIVTARISSIKANSTVGRFTDTNVIPIGFRPISECQFSLLNFNKRSTPASQEVIRITFQSNGTIEYYNYTSSTDQINIFPTDTIAYIASQA